MKVLDARKRALKTLLRESTADHLAHVLDLDRAIPAAAVAQLTGALRAGVESLEKRSVQTRWWAA